MARAKNISRSEARRRTREAQRADLMAAQADDPGDSDVEADDSTATATDATPAPRSKLFTLPHFREDIRALPQMFTTRRLLLLPLLLLAVGLAIALALPVIPTEAASVADLYLQFFFIPPALFTFFIAGFLAPRAAYLVGFVYGLVAAVTWTIALLGPGLSSTTTTTQGTNPDPLFLFANMIAIGVIYGTLAAAFAAWYRDFLRGMQERGRQRRAEQEIKDRTKRRDERQEARRVANAWRRVGQETDQTNTVRGKRYPARRIPAWPMCLTPCTGCGPPAGRAISDSDSTLSAITLTTSDSRSSLPST